jgi:ribosomal protein S20
MPRHKSAVKRVSTNLRDQKRNLAVKSELKTLLKRARQEPVLPKTVANRRKSRMAKMVNRTAKAS